LLEASRALVVLVGKSIEHARQVRPGGAQRGEQQPVLLGVVQALGVLGDVAEHRSQQGEVRRHGALSPVRDQQRHRAKHRLQRPVFVVDDLQRGPGEVGIGHAARRCNAPAKPRGRGSARRRGFMAG
jgi:hypothetical protein